MSKSYIFILIFINWFDFIKYTVIKKQNFIYIIIPLVVSFLSCILIVGNNRMQMVYLALCSISVLTTAFPTYKRLATSILLPTMCIVIISFTLFKQFGIVLGEDSVSSTESSDWIVGLTEYACGPENIAHTYDNFLKNGHNESFSTILSDIINYNTTIRTPGLALLRELVYNVPWTFDYAVNGTEMVSTSGLCAYYGHGFIGGLLLSAIFLLLFKTEGAGVSTCAPAAQPWLSL